MWSEHLLCMYKALGSIPGIEIRHSGTCCLASSFSWDRENNLEMETSERKKNCVVV